MKNFKLAFCALIAAAALTAASCGDTDAETQTENSAAESKSVTTSADTSEDTGTDSSSAQTAEESSLDRISAADGSSETESAADPAADSGENQTTESGGVEMVEIAPKEPEPWERPVADFCKAIQNGDAAMLLSVFPKGLNELLWDTVSEYYQYESVEEYYEKEVIPAFTDGMAEEYGSDAELSYEILSKTELDDEEIKALEEMLSEFYHYEADISQAYDLMVSLTIKGEIDWDTQSDIDLQVLEIDGEWYLNMNPNL